MSNISVYHHNTKNMHPKFTIPAHYKHKIPFILAEAIQRNQNKDLTAEVHFYLSLPPNRHRRIYKSRRQALNAMLIAILYHVNIISKQVPVSATALTQYCGLHTISLAGNQSITRGTRALIMLRNLGFITYRQCWDRVSRRYFPSEITITNRLIDLVGIRPEQWQITLNNKLANYNYIHGKQLKRVINEDDYARILRENQLKKSYEYHFKKRAISKKRTEATRAEKLVYFKGVHELRHLISRQVSDEFLKGLIPGATLNDLKRIVDKRINILKKIAQSSH